MPGSDSDLENRITALEGVIWDLDNTLYRFTADFVRLCNQAAAHTVIQAGLDISVEEAVEIGWESYYETGYSLGLFYQRYGIREEDVHHTFHDHIDHSFIEACAETVALFDKTALSHVLLTHASMGWAQKVLARLSLAPWFPQTHILPREHMNFHHKARSTKPFEMALERLELRPEQVFVVEDMIENLRLPHEMGMTTVLIHHGQKPDELPDYIDMDTENARTFLQTVGK